MKEEKKKNFVQKHKMSIFVVVSAVVMLIGLSYAWLQLTLRGTKELTLIAAGTLYLELDDSMEGGISISNAIPVSDAEGKEQTGYSFTLENKGKIDSNYTIYLDDLDLSEEQTRMDASFIRYSLVKDGKEESFLLSQINEAGNKVLDIGNINPGEKYTYNLKLWIDKDASNDVMGTAFKAQLRIEAIQDVKQTATLAITPNDASVTYDSATDDEKKEMFVMKHNPGRQQVGYSKDELTDYRYIGSDPNNYVTFNDETWRIIGIFIVEDETGKKESSIKLIRNESIGDFALDNKGVRGENDWTMSALKEVLNSGAYYNRTSGTCPAGANSATKACDFTTTGLNATAKSMIRKTKWYLGGYGNQQYEKATASDAYQYERGSAVYNTERPTSWIGEVGLMYPSDYAYAPSASSCLDKIIYSYGSNQSCKSDNWLYRSTYAQWTITPYADVSYSQFLLNAIGNMGADQTTNIHATRPAVYLKSNVKVASGDGSKANPYQLTIG